MKFKVVKKLSGFFTEKLLDKLYYTWHPVNNKYYLKDILGLKINKKVHLDYGMIFGRKTGVFF